MPIMRGTSLILACLASLATLAADIAKADSGCFDAPSARAPQIEPACRGRSCADASQPRRAPPKLPPWLMTRVASNAKPASACAVATLRRPVVAG